MSNINIHIATGDPLLDTRAAAAAATAIAAALHGSAIVAELQGPKVEQALTSSEPSPETPAGAPAEEEKPAPRKRRSSAEVKAEKEAKAKAEAEAKAAKAAPDDSGLDDLLGGDDDGPDEPVTVTVDEIKAAVAELAGKTDIETVSAILEKHGGAPAVKKIDPDRYAEVFGALGEALAAAS